MAIGTGHGGARPNSGPARKPGSVRWQREQRRLRRVPETQLPVAPAPRVAAVGAPADLPAQQAAIWAELAPHAVTAGTLTPATAWAFRDMCEAIVLKRASVSRISRDGLMLLSGEAHPLLSKHIALMARVETGLARFGLNPMGKSVTSGRDDTVDEFAEFDRPLAVIRGGKA